MEKTSIFPLKLDIAPKLYITKAQHPRHLNGILRAFGGVGRLKSLKSRAFTDPWTVDSRPYRSVRHQCAAETRLRPIPKMINSESMYEHYVSCTVIGSVRACGGVGRLEPLKSRAFKDSWIPGHLGWIVLSTQPRQV